MQRVVQGRSTDDDHPAVQERLEFIAMSTCRGRAARVLGAVMVAKKHSPPPRAVSGFTIMEIAISLAVMAVLAVGILVPLVSQLQQRNVSVTEKTLNDIKDALMGFAAVNGRLPCPAIGTSAGAEAFDPAAGNGPGNGKCTSFWGFVPARTLGITPVDREGFALDGWNNRIRYAVSNEKYGPPTPEKWLFTSTDGIRNFTISEVAKIASLLNVCDSGVGVNAGVSCATGTNLTPRTLTSNAVAVIWSIGPNGVTTGWTLKDEAQNPNPKDETSTDRLFVSHPPSDAPGNPFDDVVTWLSINTLVNRMVGAGQLP
jgi:type II secretory pathway pseudopilin PulG